jgi:SNF2 family DNA or RNA helicase
LLKKLDKNAFELKGAMSLDEKEEILLAFQKGQIKKLITKPKITGFGLNWQHCNHTVFFPTFSYEQYYQAIRRFWRYGQTKEVTVDLVYSDGQKRVLDSLLDKADKATELFSQLNANINRDYAVKKSEFNQPVNLPNFL